ncbi:hypothetical protein [Paenibacillus wynnii]|uniref:hypothetical protein n=1 Tax=Paenibacillus wynnii TaxID=268407 RepID=UPI00068A1359|nr:hypothetical protein [Paenibacillus wynnii]
MADYYQNRLSINPYPPAPSDVYFATVELMRSGELFHHVWVSLWRASIGFLIGGSIGFMFGLFNGLFRTTELLFDTSIQMLVPITLSRPRQKDKPAFSSIVNQILNHIIGLPANSYLTIRTRTIWSMPLTLFQK